MQGIRYSTLRCVRVIGGAAVSGERDNVLCIVITTSSSVSPLVRRLE